MSTPTLLYGYWILTSDRARRGVVAPLLMQAARLHRDLNAPCTFFVRGDLVEDYLADLQRVQDVCGDLADLEQCTWSGAPLKTVCQENHHGVQVIPAAPRDAVCGEIARTSDLMEQRLGARPAGLAGPLGYYRGLSDRPDLLYRLRGIGIRFTRTWTRNAKDWTPVPFEVQPFPYAAQGCDDILEIPGQGALTIEECEAAARRDPQRFLRHVRKDIDYVAARGLTWSWVQHDVCAIQDDPELRMTRALLDYARERGLTPLTHRAYAESR